LLRIWPTPARDRALVLGFNAAFALAQDLQGILTDQQVSSINTQLRLLELGNIAFPVKPAGAEGNALPAAQFAQQVAGALEARSTGHKAAFLLGWFGVIATNSPEVAPPGFGLRSQAKQAGYRDSLLIANDADYLQSLVDRARRRSMA
jgi:hypothetical protein